jgi:hypothetical protein
MYRWDAWEIEFVVLSSLPSNGVGMILCPVGGSASGIRYLCTRAMTSDGDCASLNFGFVVQMFRWLFTAMQVLSAE